MNIVQPIRDKGIIQEIKEFYKKQNERNYILFLLGINTGFRISDILRLRVRDVEGWNIVIREKKTRKIKDVKIPSELKRAIRNYTEGKPAQEFGLERIGAHSLRKTYGYHHYQQFRDVAVLQQMLNHAEQKETLRYIRIEQDTLNDYQKKFRI